MNGNITIGIVDYGVGNIHSAVKAMTKFCPKVIVTEDGATLESCDAIVLPGVGSFESGMKGLEVRGLIGVIKKIAEKNTPMLGICLGAQLMLTHGHEFGKFDGLDIIQGEVKHFPKLSPGTKIPHIGWNAIQKPRTSTWDNTIFSKISNGSNVYFVHSYYLEPKNHDNCLTTTLYGGFEFCSTVRKGNIYGCQFHPEKSGTIGLEIIKQFIQSLA